MNTIYPSPGFGSRVKKPDSHKKKIIHKTLKRSTHPIISTNASAQVVKLEPKNLALNSKQSNLPLSKDSTTSFINNKTILSILNSFWSFVIEESKVQVHDVFHPAKKKEREKRVIELAKEDFSKKYENILGEKYGYIDSSDRTWLYSTYHNNKYQDQVWKTHIKVTNAGQMPAVLSVVLPILHRRQLWHKITKFKFFIESLDDLQWGKAIAIYFKHSRSAARASLELDKALFDKLGEDSDPEIQYDKLLPNSKSNRVYYRYAKGSYTKDANGNPVKINPKAPAIPQGIPDGVEQYIARKQRGDALPTRI